MGIRISLAIIMGVIISLAGAVDAASAGELKYRPVNPNFGGHPLNGPYLLGNATSQRQFQAPKRKRTPAIEEFADTIQRTLLREVARDVAEAILGEEGRESGTFQVGEMQIDFNRVGEEVVINIQDPQVEGTTTITVPIPELAEF